MTCLFALSIAIASVVGTAPEKTVILPATRDAWFSGVGAEADGNNGAAPRLKVKSHQEMSVVDFDVSGLKGRVIAKATLRLKSAGEPRLKRVSVGGLASDWVEGTGSGYEVQAGSSTFNHRAHPSTPWTADGGDLCSVLFGPRGALWGTADATGPDAEGWQTVAVDPRVVAARVSGLSRGFVVYDDTGTEWTRDREKYEQRPMPNRFVFSRDQNRASAPSLVVGLGADDREPPMSPPAVRGGPLDLPAGQMQLSWQTPADRGPAGTFGFLVTVGGVAVPTGLVPLANKPGEWVSLIWDAGVKATPADVTIAAVDAAGNVGPPAKLAIRPSERRAPELPPAATRPASPQAPWPRLGEAEVAVIDELDKIHPIRGVMIPPHPEEYLATNHLWAAARPEITLESARNEFVAYQVVLRGTARGLSARVEFDGPDKVTTSVGRYQNVETKDGPLPDPIVPLTGPVDVPEAGQRSASLHVEVYVPHDARPGLHSGKMTLHSGRDRLVLPITLTVGEFTLPDSLSFLPEMNCYGLPENERDYYRLAQVHRVFLNRVPYSHNGKVHEGSAPGWDGKTLDWSAWDKRFGPLFDGSAFAGLPRAGVPIEAFYLPLFENWPSAIEPNYNGDYWADRAFAPAYRRNFVEVSHQVAEHLRSKGWDSTMFECFFNGKNDFKRPGWSRGTSPWLLDEPAHFQDFWALRYFGQAWHEGINLAKPGKARLAFRADISRPQWQRDVLDDVLDVNVCGSAFRRYRPMVLERKERLGQVVFEYGGSNPIESSNVQPAAWTLDVWTLGADGVLPWQTIGTADSWTKADELSLFYPGRDGGPPIPSVRLKAYRRGQQDVEYLTLFARATGLPRWAVAERVREALHLEGARSGTGFVGGEDAGRIDFDKVTPADLWALRARIGRALSLARPPVQRRIPAPTFPRREPGPMADRVVKD